MVLLELPAEPAAAGADLLEALVVSALVDPAGVVEGVGRGLFVLLVVSSLLLWEPDLLKLAPAPLAKPVSIFKQR